MINVDAVTSTNVQIEVYLCVFAVNYVQTQSVASTASVSLDLFRQMVVRPAEISTSVTMHYSTTAANNA